MKVSMSLVVVAVGSLGLCAIAGWPLGARAAGAGTAYGGGVVKYQTEASPDGDGVASAETVKLSNTSGITIQDFTIRILPGGVVKKVRIEDGNEKETGDFNVDDDGSNDVSDDEKASGDDNDDQRPSEDSNSVKVINSKAAGIKSGATASKGGKFSIYIEFVPSTPAGQDTFIEFQATKRRKDKGPGDGGPDILANASIGAPGGGGSGTRMASMSNAMGNTAAAIPALNESGLPIMAVTFAAQGGAVLADVSSGRLEFPAIWNAATQTLTFATPVPDGELLDLVMDFSVLGTGDETTVEWTPQF